MSNVRSRKGDSRAATARRGQDGRNIGQSTRACSVGGYQGNSSFVGRTECVSWFDKALSSIEPLSINVCGEPGIGKTALLRHLFDRYSSNSTATKLCIFVSLAEYFEMDRAKFWSTIFHELTKASAGQDNGSDNPSDPEPLGPRAAFLKIHKLLDDLKLSGNYQYVLVFIDDSEKLLPWIDNSDLDWWRYLIQKHHGYLSFVIAGSDSLYNILREKFSNDVSSLTDKFDDYQLGLLDKSEAEILINQEACRLIKQAPGDAIEIDPTYIKFLLAEAGRHPAFLQIACRQLFRDMTHETLASALVHDSVSFDYYDTKVRSLCALLFVNRSSSSDVDDRWLLFLIAKGRHDEVDRIELRRLENRRALVEARKSKGGGKIICLFSNAFAFWVKRMWAEREINEINPLLSPERSNLHGQQSVRVQTIDYLSGKHAIRIRGDEVRLTKLQDSLLRTLLSNEGNVLSNKQLLSQVWEPGRLEAVVPKMVQQLRAKVDVDSEDQPRIVTHYNHGYSLRRGTIRVVNE